MSNHKEKAHRIRYVIHMVIRILMIIGIVFSIIVISIFNDIRYFSIPSTLVALGTMLFGLMLLMMSVVLFAIQSAVRNR